MKRLEPHVKISPKNNLKKIKNEKQEEHFSKKHLFLYGTGIVLYLIAIIFDFSNNLEFCLFFASYLLIGFDILYSAFRNILRGELFDENFLMCIATIGAFCIQEYPEAVGVMIFFKIGEYFQDMAVNRSRQSISELMDIRPDFANIKVGDEIKKVDPFEVKKGDIIVVKAGEKIPLDGKIVEGKSTLDTKALTGESMPVDVTINDEVLSGSINETGLLHIEVTKVFSESTVSKILELVENSSSNKAPTENFITKFAKYYTPIVVLLAGILAFLPPLFFDIALAESVNRALVFLVVSCPCALVVSIPLGFFGGIGAGSKQGILIKGSNYLEALNSVDTVVFDKTGTLTKGIFNVSKVNNEDIVSKDELKILKLY